MPQRSPRVRILPLHHIAFVQDGSQPIQIGNISPEGIGLIRSSYEQQRPAVSAGQVIQGFLAFGRQMVPVRFRVVHISPMIIGGEYFNVDASLPFKLEDAIRRYFDLEFAALNMLEVNAKYHRKEPDGETHWFHGDNSELYYVEASGEVLRFRIRFMGNHIEGGKDQDLVCGRIVAESPSDKPSIKGSTTHQETEFTPALAAATLKFLGNVPALPTAHLESISRIIKKSLS